MKKFLATAIVLGGVLVGSNIYAAETPKANHHSQDGKKIVVVDKEAAFQSAIQQFYQNLKSEMNKQQTPKKQDPAKNPANTSREPEKMGRVALGIINSQIKDDENKVAASVNANIVVNNGKLENMVVSGHAGLASAILNFDTRTGQSTTNLSYADKKGSRVEVTLRDCKNPIVRIATPLKFIKGVNFAGRYDSMTNDASAQLSANYGRINGSVNYENINHLGRTTASIRYSPPFKPVKFISLTHVEFNGVKYYAFDALSRLKGFDIGVSARKIGDGKVRPSFIVKWSYSK